MAENVFAYGTLEVAEIMETVTGRRFSSCPALLRGFARYRLQNRVYPGLVEEAGAETLGTLYRSIDSQTMALLDRFEGGFYCRRMVTVLTSGGPRPAWSYLLADRYRYLLSARPWSMAEFINRDLARFQAEELGHRSAEAKG